MAIFIVDQFSLNTDLPLDIRYVPDGGSYNDVSAYWYPGMQVYQTTDQKIWYADNSLNWHPISEGIDASISALYDLFVDLSTYTYNNIAQLNSSIGRIDTSINDIYVRLQTIDTSIVALDASVKTLFTWQIAQDASLVDLRNTDLSQDASIVDLRNTDLSQDASIVALRNTDISLDASVQLINTWQLSQDASIELLRAKDASIDASLNMLGQWNASQDSSIADLRTDISNLDSSLDLFVLKSGDTMSGPLTITSGGLVVGSIGTPVDTSLFGNLYVNQNLGVKGNLTINGSLYVVGTEQVDISTAYIHLNTGLTGVPPATLQSGIIIGRGSSEPYVFIFDETNQTFRIGVAQETSTGYLDASTQAVATRQDSPVINGVAVWNDTETRFDTFTQVTYDGSTFRLDSSLNLPKYAGASNLMLVVAPDGTVKSIPTSDASINDLYTYIDGSLALRDTSIAYLNTQRQQLDASIVRIDGSINTLFTRVDTIDSSITYIDSSINQLFAKDASSIKGGVNIGDGSAGIFAGIDSSMNLMFKEIRASGSIVVTQDASNIIFAFDASASGDVASASNIGTGEGVFAQKNLKDLEFKSLTSLDPSTFIITSDASNIYFDVSISTATALSELTDVSLSVPLTAHQIVEYDASDAIWKNTNNILWDNSLGITSNDFGSIPAGTNLSGLTLKEILYKMLYEYQIPILSTSTSPVPGTYEKGLVGTQFASIDIDWSAANTNYPLALLNNVHITKTGAGSIFDASLGLVASDVSTYTDTTGITSWGGTNRTITYNITVDDDQDQPQPAVGSSKSFTFYYRQFWGAVDGNTNIGAVTSSMITGLSDSRLAGETDLAATFVNPGTGKIKYLFAYPDTVAIPDNFGPLSQILDQNDFDITSSWDTAQPDVSVGVNNVRYRVYLLKNKVDTPSFDVTFKF